MMVYVFVVVVLVIIISKSISAKKKDEQLNVKNTDDVNIIKPLKVTRTINTTISTNDDDLFEFEKTKYKSFKNLDAMIKATMPEGLNPEEEKFFRKWYHRFGFNSDKNTNDYLEYVKNSTSSNPMRFRDHLYGFSRHLKTEKWVQDKYTKLTKEQRDFDNAYNLERSAEYMIDEIKLIGKFTKAGKLRSQVSGSLKFLEDAIMKFNTNNVKTYMIAIKHIEKYYPERKSEIPSIIAIASKNCDGKISNTNDAWFKKKFDKYNNM